MCTFYVLLSCDGSKLSLVGVLGVSLVIGSSKSVAEESAGLNMKHESYTKVEYSLVYENQFQK